MVNCTSIIGAVSVSEREREHKSSWIFVREFWANPTKTNVEFIIEFVRYYYYM